jgi:hypothetical protein
VFRLEETRAIGHDWVVRYRNRALQLARQSAYAPARSRVTVCEWPDGRVAIEYRGHALPWTERTEPDAVRSAPEPTGPLPPLPPSPSRPAPANHPWRQGYQRMRADVPIWRVADQ